MRSPQLENGNDSPPSYDYIVPYTYTYDVSSLRLFMQYLVKTASLQKEYMEHEVQRKRTKV